MSREGQSYKGTNLWWMQVNKPLPLMNIEGVCYAYPHHEVYLNDNEFIQTRSGPNWEGGLLTIATCKHLLRSRLPSPYKIPMSGLLTLTGGVEMYTWDSEPSVWLAGFTPTIDGATYLLYMARVGVVFGSNYDLGAYLKSNYRSAYDAKLAMDNVRGDVYKPRKKLRGEGKFDPLNFYTPYNHCRQVESYKDGTPKWHRDIAYSVNGRRAYPILFDEVYLYSKPKYAANRKLFRSGYKDEARYLGIRSI